MSLWGDVDEDGLPLQRKKTKKVHNVEDLIEDAVAKSLHLARPDPSGYITQDWTDPKTGLTYQVREKAAQGPQGDFRVNPLESDARQKAMMGLPRTTAAEWRPTDRILKESNVQDSEYYQQQNLLRNERLRTMQQVKRDSLFGAHREKAEDSDSELRDVPLEMKRPTGSFPTQNFRGVRDETIVGPSKTLPDLNRMGTAKVFGQSLIEQSLAKRDILSKAQASAFRGLFGEAAANQMAKRTSSEKVKNDTFANRVVHAVIEQGLVAPKMQAEKAEGPLRQDTLAQHIGTRALEGLSSAQARPELELPLAQRDLLAVALGRTILQMTEHAMASKTASELIELSKQADSSLQRTNQVPRAMVSSTGPKQASDLEVQKRHDSLNGSHMKNIQNVSNRGQGPELLSENQRQDLLSSDVSRVIFAEAYGSIEKPELLEPSKKIDLLVQSMLKRPVLSPETVQSLCRPEVLAQKAKDELVRRHVIGPSIQGPEARVQTLYNDRPIQRQKDIAFTRPEQAHQELTPGQNQLLQGRVFHDSHEMTKVPRDIQAEVSRPRKTIEDF